MDLVTAVVIAAVVLVPAVRMVRRRVLSTILRCLCALVGAAGIAFAAEIATAVTDEEQDSTDSTYIFFSLACAIPALVLLAVAWKGPSRG